MFDSIAWYSIVFNTNYYIVLYSILQLGMLLLINCYYVVCLGIITNYFLLFI